MTDYNKIYDEDFFKDRNATTRYAAEKILDIATDSIPHVNSAADLGCGVGTWLSVLAERGASDVQGFDGPWVKKDLLQIPVDSFQESNLQKPVAADRTYDLAISLEVAEHLPEASADTFVESLTKLSDFVLFSAAIPDQGGVNHVNEQWQSYWAHKFSDKEYVPFDLIRSKIWSDKRISIPYRQNIILYVAQSRVAEVRAESSDIGALSVAHPELYEIRNSKSVRQALSDLKMTVSDKLMRKLGRG